MVKITWFPYLSEKNILRYDVARPRVKRVHCDRDKKEKNIHLPFQKWLDTNIRSIKIARFIQIGILLFRRTGTVQLSSVIFLISDAAVNIP